MKIYLLAYLVFEEFASYLLIFNYLWSPESLGDTLLWVGVRHRPAYANVFFSETTKTIFTFGI